MSHSASADLWYQAVDEVRSWDTLAAWQGASALPTSSDRINLNNASIVVPNYLRITNGVVAAASELYVGEQKMDDGRLVGSGTHDELLKAKGIYYGLVLAQLNMTRLVGQEEISEEEFLSGE